MGLWSGPVLHELTATSDVCGHIAIAVDVEASGRALEVWVDGVQSERFRVDGRQTIHHLVDVVPGTEHTVEARFSDKVRLQTAVTALAAGEVVTLTHDPERIYQNEPAWADLVVGDGCADESSPSYEIQQDGQSIGRGTMLPANKTARVTLDTSVPPGAIRLTAQTSLSAAVSESDALLLYLEPPCVDADADGLRTCDGDCDDADDRRGTCEPSSDRDRDGYPDLASGGTDCNDANSSVHPGAVDAIDADGDGFVVRDGLDQDCNGVVDNGATNVDCDDTNRLVNPGREEAGQPNGIDDNCDGRIDEGTRAYDDDGDGLSENDGDCDDTDPLVSPEAQETADCRDEDCDGVIDEDLEPLVMDDAFEANDSRETAHDLGGRGRNRLSRTLEVNTRDASDEEWFSFWSSDGPFDSWGITATMAKGPHQSRVELSIHAEDGRTLATRTVSADGQQVSVRGRGMSSDSGTYLLRIRSLAQPHDYCRARVQLVSR